MEVIKLDSTVFLEVSEGTFKQYTAQSLVEAITRGTKRRQRNNTATGKVKRQIGLYNYAQENGKYVNGHPADKIGMLKLRTKILDGILGLLEHEKAQFDTFVKGK